MVLLNTYRSKKKWERLCRLHTPQATSIKYKYNETFIMWSSHIDMQSHTAYRKLFFQVASINNSTGCRESPWTNLKCSISVKCKMFYSVYSKTVINNPTKFYSICSACITRSILHLKLSPALRTGCRKSHLDQN